MKSFNFSKINNNSHNKSNSSRIRLKKRNNQNSFPKPKKPENKKNNTLNYSDKNNIPNGIIDLTKEKKKSPIKNEEMMKQIKNTIDDNLKIMLNFSYENFLRKESEHESKDFSREIEINNESNGNLSNNN